MIHASIRGRLGGDPVQRETRAGKEMVTASAAVDVAKPGEEPVSEWISIVAFGAVAKLLAQHAKGDAISAMGSMTRSTFTGRDGQERTSWSLLVESILSARTAAGNKRSREQHNGARARTGRGRKSPYAVQHRPTSVSGPPPPDDPVADLWRGGPS
jgi:single-strand DNA-binding protein